ncbi:MAG: glutaredoxin domain-containing protein [Candidatus Woesearchaeota archaeon]|nr:glutaredoxin domain-containing protein [Candidatus Woesearchaeota archaeon]MDP7457710.1 glutaredoxin domain-containing protein [Candidatus Woesearchaeota archaeon]
MEDHKKSDKVVVYSTDACPWCHKAKDFLDEMKVEYEDLNVGTDEKARNDMIEKSGQMGVPVLDVKGTIIIGFDEPKIREALGLDSEAKKAA